MIGTIYKINRLNFKKVSYYTIQFEGRDSEFDDFLKRMSRVDSYRSELQNFAIFLKEIGNRHGANTYQFKHERAADALPPPYHYIQTKKENEFGIRLYCIRLSDSIVILLNGDMKTHLYPDKCKNCKRHFDLANRVSKKIQEAIVDGYIRLNGKVIELDDDFELDL